MSDMQIVFTLCLLWVVAFIFSIWFADRVVQGKFKKNTPKKEPKECYFETATETITIIN